MKGTGLIRHLTMLMIQVIFFSVAISFSVYYVCYGMTLLINGPGEVLYQPSSDEWIQFGVSTLLSLIVAVMTAVKFSRMMLLPLNSLAESARNIARGELSARAVAGDRKLTEISALVDDFNTMAKRLETASGEITTWNAAIAHELRTPVTILRGRLQGLADGVFQPDHTLFLNLVKQTDGLARLIEDLRTLSLAESGHLLLHWEITEISREVTAVAEVMRPSLAERGLSLVLKLDDITLKCDGARIRQALMALLDNARRYAQPGIVMVSCVQSDERAIITVEDEGPGISAEIGGTLFNAFSRGDQSRSRESGGTGLGLSVVRAITKAHAGKVACGESRLGGTAFRLILNRCGNSGERVWVRKATEE